MSWKAVEHLLCYREVAAKHRENRERRDKIGLRLREGFMEEELSKRVETRQVGGTAGIVTCCHPTPERKGKTLGHFPPIQGLWKI